MRISELADESQIPLASIKYYLREGLLMPGRATSPTQAVYTHEHVRRVRLIRALTHVAGLPIQTVKVILDLIDHPGPSLFETAGKAIAATTPGSDGDEQARDDYPLARAALEKVGQIYEPRFSAVGQLDAALRAVSDAGLPLSDERLQVYAEHMRAIAAADLERMPRSSPQDSLEYAVLGTVLYEPVLLALRRLAHQHIAARLLDEPPNGE